MKKVILLISLTLSSLFGNSELKYVDLYGEIQVNLVIANKCLEEVAYTQKLNGEQCITFAKYIDTDVYKRVIPRKYSDFNTKDSFWSKEDWVILKNQMKKLIYVNDLVKQFK